jgi:hypothetical protein
LEEKVDIPIGKHVNSDESAAFGSLYYAASTKGKDIGLKISLKESNPPKEGGNLSPLTEEQFEISKEKLRKLDEREARIRKAQEGKYILKIVIQ